MGCCICIQKRLGHAHVQTTLDTYVHLSDQDMKNEYKESLRRKNMTMKFPSVATNRKLITSTEINKKIANMTSVFKGYWAADRWDISSAS